MNSSGHNSSFVPYHPQVASEPPKPPRGAVLSSYLFLAALWNAAAVFSYGALAGLAGLADKSRLTVHTSAAGAMSLRRVALFGALLAAVKVMLVVGMWSWKRIAVMAYATAGVLSILVTIKSHTPPIYELVSLTVFVLIVGSRWAHFD